MLVPKSSVTAFLAKNHSWIVKKLAASNQSKLINDGDVLAPNTRVSFVSSSEPEINITNDKLGLKVSYPSSLDVADKQLQTAVVKALVPIWRAKAKEYLPARLESLATTYGFKLKEVRLKNIHSRWGSCTSTGNINLNIQLMKLDEDLIDHVLLHELTHTKALNHGADFWSLFESVRPGARKERKQLKQMVIF